MRVLTIAWYTFLEMVRSKVLYILFFFALFILALGIAMTRMTIGNELDIVSDIGLGTIEIFSVALAIFLGVSIVQKELQLKTLHPLLARPMSRAEYMLGKFLGMELMLAVEIFFMLLIFITELAVYGGVERFVIYLPAVYTIFIQTSMVISVAVLCSTLAEPAVGAMLTISYWLIGTTSYNLVYLIDSKAGEGLKKAVAILRYVLPDFSHFNIKDNLVYGRGLENIHLGWATLYGCASIILVLALSIIIFNKKEIN